MRYSLLLQGCTLELNNVVHHAMVTLHEKDKFSGNLLMVTQSALFPISSQKTIFTEVLNLISIHRSNIAILIKQKIFWLNLSKLKYQSKQQENRQYSYNFQNLEVNSNISVWNLVFIWHLQRKFTE